MSEDRPQYQAERDPVPTHAEIAERLRSLSEQLADLGCDMEFLGGFGPMVQQGRLLIETARIARTWAQEIEGEAK